MSQFLGSFCTFLFALNLFISTAFAQMPASFSLKSGAPTTYTVIQGDTLWGISAMYLDSPWLWPQLWELNSDIENPHLIYPGDQLQLVWLNGKPLLKSKPKIVLSPRAHKVNKQAVPVVEQGLVLPYLQSDRLVSQELIAESSRVVGDAEGHQYMTGQDKLYFTGRHSHRLWGVYRLSEQFKRDDQTMLALRFIAMGELVETDKNISALRITEQSQEVMQNDIVLPLVDIDSLKLTTTFFPRPASKNIQTHILGSLDGSQYVAQHQVVVLDRGGDDGLRQGSMFEVFQAGSRVFNNGEHFSYEQEWFDESRNLPRKKVGELMVIRPYAKFSLALVTSSQSAISRDVIAISPLSIPPHFQSSLRNE